MSKEADKEEIMDALREVLDTLDPEQLAKLKADLGHFNFLLRRACDEVLRVSKSKASKVPC